MNRLTRGLADAEAEITNANVTLGDVQTTLNQALKAAANCQAQYEQAPGHVRRLINQGFFKKLYIGADGEVERYELTEPFATLLGDEVAIPTTARQTDQDEWGGSGARQDDEASERQPEAVQDTPGQDVEAPGQAWPTGVLERTFALVTDSTKPQAGRLGLGLKERDVVGQVGVEPTT